MKVSVLPVFLAFLMISCNNSQDKILQQAESLIEAYPDSTLTLLRSINDPEKLPLDEYNKYILLTAKAEYKKGVDTQEDTLLVKAKNYFISKNDLENAAWASLYCGHIHYKQNEYDKALFQYLEAEQYSLNIRDNYLNGIIQYAVGKVYSTESAGKRQALDRFFLANKYFRDSGNLEKELRTTQAIGDCYLHLHNDSAMIYYEKAVELSDKISGSQTENLSGIAIAYSQTGDNKNARSFTLKAISQSPDSTSRISLLFNLAQFYNEAGMLDSARYCFNSLLEKVQGKDVFIEQNIYASLSDVEEKAGNLRQSLDYFRKYSKCLKSIKSDREIAAISQMQNRYNYQLLKNKNNELVIERQKIIILVIILGIVILSTLFFLYRKSKLNKSLLTEIEQTVSQLREMSKGYDEKENSFRMVLLQHFGNTGNRRQY